MLYFFLHLSIDSNVAADNVDDGTFEKIFSKTLFSSASIIPSFSNAIPSEILSH